MEAGNIIENLYHSHARNIQRMCYLYLGGGGVGGYHAGDFLKAYEKYSFSGGK